MSSINAGTKSIRFNLVSALYIVEFAPSFNEVKIRRNISGIYFYLRERKPVEGLAEFEAEWKGAKRFFATEQDREMFTREPEKYAPQYGGYCARAAGHGYTAKGDPEAWKIVDGKLYRNYNKDVKKRWEEDIPATSRREMETGPRFKRQA